MKFDNFCYLSSSFSKVLETSLKTINYGQIISMNLQNTQKILENSMINQWKKTQEKMIEALSSVLAFQCNIELIKRSIASFHINTQLLSNALENAFKNFDLEIDEEGDSYIVDKDNKEYISRDEVEELKKDILNIVEKNFEEKSFKDSEKKWNERHPVLLAILLIVLEAIINLFLSYITDGITKKDSYIYSEPNKNSSIIISIPENTSITIYDSGEKYYYNVIYTDTINDKDVEGYIYKGNVVKNIG